MAKADLVTAERTRRCGSSGLGDAWMACCRLRRHPVADKARQGRRALFAGRSADTLGRLLFAAVQEAVGQALVIDNRGGGGGTIGAGVVAKAPPDGYTVLHDATAFSVNPALLPSLPYDTVKDFAGISRRHGAQSARRASVEHKTVAAILAEATTGRPLDWASSGNGTVQHLSLELLRLQAGIPLNHIPYKGGAPALNDVMGGHVKYMFSNAAASTPHVQAGKLKAIGARAKAAWPHFPMSRPFRIRCPASSRSNGTVCSCRQARARISSHV